MRPYKYRMEKVGDYGAAGKFYGPGLEAGKAIVGPSELNMAYMSGYLDGIKAVVREVKSKDKPDGGR